MRSNIEGSKKVSRKLEKLPKLTFLIPEIVQSLFFIWEIFIEANRKDGDEKN